MDSVGYIKGEKAVYTDKKQRNEPCTDPVISLEFIEDREKAHPGHHTQNDGIVIRMGEDVRDAGIGIIQVCNDGDGNGITKNHAKKKDMFFHWMIDGTLFLHWNPKIYFFGNIEKKNR